METACYICRKTDQNELEYGEFLTKGKLSVHYFCLVSLDKLRLPINYDLIAWFLYPLCIFSSDQLFSNDLVQDCRSEKGGIRRFNMHGIRKLYRASKQCVSSML